MGEELRSVSLCLLDDVNVSNSLKLDEFEIRHYQPDELQALLSGAEMGSVSSKASDRLKVYAECLWARLERPIPPDKVKTNPDPRLKLRLQQLQLSWHHAGRQSWYPFDDLLRTLNLLKATAGPVIGRQFYRWLEPSAEPDRRIDRVIYGEPLCCDYFNPDGQSIRSRVPGEYDLGPSDTEWFSQLRKRLGGCLAADSKADNSHLRTAIHYFENGDRKIVPRPLLGSFDAIEPLMSYEAALEALLVREDERGVEDRLARRVASLMKKRGRGIDKVGDFARRVFWLRSKVAHGARPIKEIENLIVHKPNDEIVDNERKKPRSIPRGNYASLLITGSTFPGFLVNLRELTRISIGFFCDALSQRQDKATTIDSLDKTD